MNPPELLSQAETAMKDFSQEGLRTLVLAYRELSQEEFTAFKGVYESAEREINGRRRQLEELAKRLKLSLFLLDALQLKIDYKMKFLKL